MNDLPPPLLAALVMGIAFLYASIGFGGATGYLAVMSQFGIEPNLMASTALILNIVVAGLSFVNYLRAGHLRKDLFWPFLVTSVPAAFIGGIFLSPLIILAHWGTPKQTAATAAGFIVLNSVSGLAGRLVGGNLMLGTFGVALIPLGIVGALAGSYLGARSFSSLWTRRILGVVLLIAIANYIIGRFR